MKPYQRFLTSEFQPFDPVELARGTEEITTREGPEGLELKICGDLLRSCIWRNRHGLCCRLLSPLRIVLG
jgi:hypothetical protein